MKTEVNQLKLTVTNIKSVLLSSSKKMVKIKKDNDRLREDAIKLQAISMKETSLESTPPSKKAPNKKKKINAEGSIFGKAKSLFGIIIGGIFVNALEGLVETLKNFYKDNEPVFNKVADIFVGFGKGLISVWDNSKELRKKIKEGVEKIDAEDIKNKFNQLKNISDDIQKKLSPIINNDGSIKNKDIKSKIEENKKGEKGEKEPLFKKLGESFDDSASESMIKIARAMYYLDQNGNVRRKSDNKKAEWEFLNSYSLYNNIHEDVLDVIPYNGGISPVKKNNNLQALNNGDDGGTTVIIAKQFIEV